MCPRAPSVRQGSHGVGSVPGPALDLHLSPSLAVASTSWIIHSAPHPLQRCQRSGDSHGRAFIAFKNLLFAHRGRSGNPQAPLKLIGTVLSPAFISTPQKLGFHTLSFRHCPFPNGIISSHFKLQIHPQGPQLLWHMFEVTHTDLK